MDVERHLSVIGRSKLIIACGVLLATVLAILAVFQVSLSGGPSLQYRKAEVWTATSKLLVTQDGFPYGRAVLPGATPDASTAAMPDGSSPDFVDPARFAYLAWIYSHFLMGDEIRAMLPVRPHGMKLEAGPLTAGGNLSASALPLIELNASADTAKGAEALNVGATNALELYLQRQQRAVDVPSTQRAKVSIVNRAPIAELTKGHSMTLGIVVFLLVMGGALALVYALENLRLARARRATDAAIPDGLFGIDADEPGTPPLTGAPLERTGTR